VTQSIEEVDRLLTFELFCEPSLHVANHFEHLQTLLSVSGQSRNFRQQSGSRQDTLSVISTSPWYFHAIRLPV
jgi:hypothetical protein